MLFGLCHCALYFVKFLNAAIAPQHAHWYSLPFASTQLHEGIRLTDERGFQTASLLAYHPSAVLYYGPHLLRTCAECCRPRRR